MRSDWPRGEFAWDFVKMVLTLRCFCFSRAHQASTNSISLYFIYPILRRLKLGKSLQTSCDNFFRLSWHFKREKSVCWKSSFVQNKNWSRVQDSVYKTLRLVRISLLISAITKSFAFFSRESHVITVSNSPNPSSIYIRLCKHGKVFYCLNGIIFIHSKYFPDSDWLKAHA